MKSIKKLFQEIWLQLTLTPPFASKHHAVLDKPTPHLEAVSQEISQCIKNPSHRLIFLIAPLGVGKSDYVQYFTEQHPHLHFAYKSFMRVREMDFAFLHLINYWFRITFVTLCFTFTYFLGKQFPLTLSIPFLIILAYCFKKNPANLLYILHEALDNFLTRKSRVVIIDDLDKCALDEKDRWSLLINLWANKRTYLVSLSYSLQEGDKFKIQEWISRLGGILIEIPLTPQMELDSIKKSDPDFPFIFEKHPHNWFTLLSKEDFAEIRKQIPLISEKQSQGSASDKHAAYINACLGVLAKKLDMHNNSLHWNSLLLKIEGLSLHDLPEEKRNYFQSFIHTIKNPKNK